MLYKERDESLLPPLSSGATYRNFVISKMKDQHETNAQRAAEERKYWADLCTRDPGDGGLPICPQLPLRKVSIDLSS